MGYINVTKNNVLIRIKTCYQYTQIDQKNKQNSNFILMLKILIFFQVKSFMSCFSLKVTLQLLAKDYR